jgi:protein-S-isoprenylcysteine O-methyltransferase Ste14
MAKYFVQWSDFIVLTLTANKISFCNAWIFMSVFILQMLLMAFSTKQKRKRSHVPKNERQTVLEKYTGITANLIWLLLLFYSVFLPLLFETFWFFIGSAVYMFGALILLFAILNFITTPIDQVIQSGVYKFSRHPMYLAIILICLGSGIATASWIFILLSILLAVCLHFEALVEERYCLNKYKEEYKEYFDCVPRWIGMPK